MDYDTNNKYIIIIGNFGAGQDIIAKFLKKKFKKVKVMDSLNNHSMDFVTQMETTSIIYEAMKKNDKFYKNQVFVSDSFPLYIQNCIIPALHSLNKINDREVIVYRKWIKILEEYDIKLIINLNLNVNICFERMLDIDPNINYDLLLSMEKQLESWNLNTENNVINIDMNKYIFMEENEVLEKELLRKFMKFKPDLFNSIKI